MARHIDARRQVYGVEPIWDALQVAPSTYYSARSRPLCERRRRDEELRAHDPAAQSSLFEAVETQ